MPLTQQECAAAIAEHSRGFAEAAGGNLDAEVEFCPGWTVRDVVHHLTRVQWFWATLVEEGEQKWLVAPYGPVPWVLNARAAGRVTVSRRGVSTMYLVTEVSAAEAGPVLKEYLRIAGATRSYFAATKDAPAADFAAEAHHHPVFALTPVE